MGMRGPPKTPSIISIARGNPGKRPLNYDEPELEAVKSAKSPKGLKGRAKTEWDRLAPELIAKGVLTVGDMHAFEEYCRMVGEVDSYEKMITRVGHANAHRLGYAGYILKLRTQLRQQAAHLGLTPSSRSNVKVVIPKSKDAKRERFFGASGRRA